MLVNGFKANRSALFICEYIHGTKYAIIPQNQKLTTESYEDISEYKYLGIKKCKASDLSGSN